MLYQLSYLGTGSDGRSLMAEKPPCVQSCAALEGILSLFIGLAALLFLGRFAGGNAVVAAEPAAEIDHGAARRAEGPVLGAGGLAADRARPLFRGHRIGHAALDGVRRGGCRSCRAAGPARVSARWGGRDASRAPATPLAPRLPALQRPRGEDGGAARDRASPRLREEASAALRGPR